jgi:hypothetical protein
MAVVESAEREVVVELGVPLALVSTESGMIWENARHVSGSIPVGWKFWHIDQGRGSHCVAAGSELDIFRL